MHGILPPHARTRHQASLLAAQASANRRLRASKLSLNWFGASEVAYFRRMRSPAGAGPFSLGLGDAGIRPGEVRPRGAAWLARISREMHAINLTALSASKRRNSDRAAGRQS